MTGSSDPTIDTTLADITATFGDGRVSGSSGVNRYSGHYAASSDGSFGAGPLASTLMAGPEELMRTERAYLTLLGRADSFAVRAGRLTLAAGTGGSLTFEGSEPVDLAGSSWLVTAYNNGEHAVVGVSDQAELTIEFGTDARVTGRAGVNSYSGGFAFGTDGTVTIGPLGTTRMGGPETLMKQESRFLAALGSSTSWDVVNGVL